jgi:hypothetical protein
MTIYFKLEPKAEEGSVTIKALEEKSNIEQMAMRRFFLGLVLEPYSSIDRRDAYPAFAMRVKPNNKLLGIFSTSITSTVPPQIRHQIRLDEENDASKEGLIRLITSELKYQEESSEIAK